MNKLEKKLKKRYAVYVSTVIAVLVVVVLIVQSNINHQKHDAYLINTSGKQRFLSQTVTKLAFAIGNNLEVTYKLNALDSLRSVTDELEKSHYLLSTYEIANNATIDSLLKNGESALQKIVIASRNIVKNPDPQLIVNDITTIAKTEPSYLATMNAVANEYQRNSDKKIQKLIYVVYLLAVTGGLILIGEFLFVSAPGLRRILQKNKELSIANTNLSHSESQLKSNMEELKKLQLALEEREKYNKIFIEQAPTAIAMLDADMHYIAVSQRWISDYKMEGVEIVGRSHYDVFPEIGDDWKAKHQRCLQGEINVCDEFPFKRADGSVQWIYWDVRPWYIAEDRIGGLLMHTGDITKEKEKEAEKNRIEKIFLATNEVAQIGVWEVNLLTNEVFLSSMVLEILQAPEGYVTNLDIGLDFVKEGKSRDIINKAVENAIANGTSYDEEIELVTFKGETIWARAIGHPKIIEGTCVGLFGVFQNINEIKTTERDLHEAHTQLKAIFNSEAIGIVTTDVDGIINRFNRGAEILTGYSASEIVGIHVPKVFHFQEELDSFRIDIAKKYNKDPKGFSAQLEMAKHGAYDTREWTYNRKDGDTTPVQLTLTSIKDEQGELMGFLGVSTDISDRKKAEQAVLRKNYLLNFAEKTTLMGNWQWDVIEDSVEMSTNLFEILNVEKDIKNLNFDTYFNLVHPEDKEFVQEAYISAVRDQQLQKFTHRIITADGSLKYVQIQGEVFTDGKGTVLEMIGTCQDITEAKEAESELYEAHTQLQAIFNSGPIGIVTTDINGVINYFNHGAEILTGYKADEMIGIQKPYVYHTDEDLMKFTLDIAKRYNLDPEGIYAQLELSKRHDFDTRDWTYVRKDGSTLPIQLTLTGIKDENGKDIGFLGVSTDASERIKTESELVRKNKLLNFAEEITLMGHWQWNTVADTVVWSKNLYTMFERNVENSDIKFESYFNYTHPDDKEIVTEYFEKSKADKKFHGFTHRMITTTGKLKIIQLLGEVITNDKGDIIEMIGTCQDITQLKMAENKFRGLLESAPDAMVIMNSKGEIQLFNKQAEKLFGYAAKELFGTQVEMLIPKQFDAKDPSIKLEVDASASVAIHKNGLEVPVQISFSPLETEEGLLVSAAIRDITEQKMAENELLRKNQLLTFAEKITLMGNWQWNTITNDVKWSTNLYNIFGVEKDTAITYDTYFSFVHTEDQERVTAHVQRSIEEKNFIDLIHRIQLKDGTVKSIQLLAEINLDNSGNVIQLLGTCQDVTEQRMAENKFRGLLESAPDAMIIVNEDGEIQLINKQTEKLFGYSGDELLGKNAEILVPEALKSVYSEINNGGYSNHRANSLMQGNELFGLHKNGQEIPVAISLNPLETAEGLLITAAIRDITLQKLAADELVRKNQLLTFAEKITMMGNWQWNTITNAVKWSANLYTIFGVEKEEAITYETYFSFVHPEDKEKVTDYVQNSIATKKKNLELLHRIQLKDGTVKIIQLLAEIITNNQDDVIEFVGTCQDVTEQKMAENKFRGLLESAPDAMVIVNEKGIIQLTNKQTEKLFGFTAEELFGKSVEILIPEKYTGTHGGFRDGFFLNPKTRGMGQGKELFGMHKNGLEIPIQISLSPLQTEEGLLVSAAIRDITEQKQTQTRIIKANVELEDLANQLTVQNDQLADFAHITSHNLRAPVSNLNSLLGFYNTSENEEDKSILFEKFEKVIHHLTLTLNTLVESLRLKNVSTEDLEDISFEEVLEKTKELLSSQIMASSAVITADFSKINKISYNKIYLESIFLNLLSNAIKYKSESRVPKIVVTSFVENGKIKLKFKDNGLGIDLERHGHKLFGLNKTFHRHEEAKGVGLFMTKSQIEAMGGTISASSKVNEGTTFTIIFKK